MVLRQVACHVPTCVALAVEQSPYCAVHDNTPWPELLTLFPPALADQSKPPPENSAYRAWRSYREKK